MNYKTHNHHNLSTVEEAESWSMWRKTNCCILLSRRRESLDQKKVTSLSLEPVPGDCGHSVITSQVCMFYSFYSMFHFDCNIPSTTLHYFASRYLLLDVGLLQPSISYSHFLYGLSISVTPLGFILKPLRL